MIVFDGYLSGVSEKWFHKRNRDFGRNIFLIALLIFLPIVIFISINKHNWLLTCLYSLLFVIIPLLTLIPQSEKEKKAVTPKKIVVSEEQIVCYADKYEETRCIYDVKVVKDYGDFYELIFPFGKISNKFICQKNLLSKGTLKEFERLFEGKIIRHGKTQD